MQAERRFSHMRDEQQQERQAISPVPARASVWIDQLEQHNISASYMDRERGEERKKRVVHPVTPIPSTPVPQRASAQGAHSSTIRPRALRSYLAPAPQQDARQRAELADTPTLPPSGGRYVRNDFPPGILSSKVATPSRSLLHPESTASRTKKASLSPHSAIDELDTVPFGTDAAHVFDMIDEIDTHSLPMSPTIDELDTLPPVQLGTSRALSRPVQSPHVLSRQSNEVDIDEIDTLAPGSVTIVVPPPRLARQAKTEPHVRIIDSRPPVEQMSSARPVSPVSPISPTRGEVSWTTGEGASEEMKRRIASKARDKQGKSLGELALAPLDALRWWLLYPGRMEFMMWIFGALLLLGVTCTLLFATLASAGIIRFSSVDSIAIAHSATDKQSVACAASAVNCHTASAHNVGKSSASHLTPVATSASTANTPAPSSTGTSRQPTGSGTSPAVPVSQTPISASPTVGVSPTSAPTQATSTPSPTATVKPSPTVVVTPTTGVTSPTPKPTTTSAKHTDTQSLSLDTVINDSNPTSRDSTYLWFWFALLGYTLSMALLGFAAFLYRRKRRTS